MTTKKTLRIVLSYPGDVKPERQLMKEVVKDVNQGVADDRNLSLELHSWDTDAHPGFHPDGPQGLIDPILKIEECDVLLGIFWKRFGTPTKKAQSGTEHEIRTAVDANVKRGRPQIMVYFKEAEYFPKTVAESEQLTRVLTFKEEFPKEGLYWTFKDELEFERLARRHLSSFIKNNYSLAEAQPIKDGVHAFVREYCLNVLPRFSGIHLFGEKRSNGEGEPTALKRMSNMERGFVPLHLKEWRDDGGLADQKPLNINALFDAGGQARRYLVRGLPGGGKTTLLRYLAHRLATLTVEGAEERVPVYIRLGRFNCQKDAALEEWVRKNINQYCDGPEMCDALLKRERFLERPMVLLLDGLDEIEDEVTSGRMAELLDELAREYPRCNIIVSSRPIGLKRRDFPQYRPLDLQPLTTAMIEDYLSRWFGAAADKIERLQRALNSKPRIYALAANPFLLSMICYTFEQGGATELIERRSQLYENCTRYLLERAYDRDSQGRRPIDLEATRSLLKEIALKFFLWQEADFAVEHVRAMGRRLQVPDAAGGTIAVLNQLERETGLIQRGQEGFTFVHRSLWEYFTALALLEKNPDFVIRQAGNPDWEEVVRLYAGLLQDAEREQELVQRLWIINRPLALRVTTETQTPATELLEPLIAGEADNRGKLLLINALAQSLDLVPAVERASLVQETLRILLVECRETDCEVIFHAEELLAQKGLQPLQPGGLIHELLDLADAAARQEALLSDPANLFEWITVEGSTFQMGDEHQEDREKPAHPVTLKAFEMAKHPVTNRLLAESGFPLGEKFPHYGGERHPAIGNTWFEAYYFALWLGARLPSEAEWEYAARGGRKARAGQYFFGDNPEELADHAWFGDSGRKTAHAVDKVNPRTERENLNPLGLANMLGNVWEWTADDWHGNYKDAPDDGRAWIDTPRGTDRVVRGGSWDGVARACRSAARSDCAPDYRSYGIGFRLARSVALGP